MRRASAILIVTYFILCNKLAAQDLAGREKAFLVKRVIELNHYSPRPVDDSFSVSLFNTLINAADARRLLFTAADYKVLSNYRLKLDDELQGNGWVFLELFANLYKRSLTRADSIINAALQKPFDFSLNESITVSKEGSWNFAATTTDIAMRWNKYFKFIALENLYHIVSAEGTQTTISKETISKYEPKIRDKIKAREIKMIKGILEHPGGFASFINEIYFNAVATTFDPHTNYFSPEGKEQFQSSLSTEGYSFGLEFDEDDKGTVVIAYLIPGGPAWKSGELNKGDELLQLYWENKPPADVSLLSTEEIDEMLEQSTQERLVIKVKKADNSFKTVMLRKEKISNEENIVRSFVLSGEKKVGYILLPGFYTQWENENGSGCANDVAKEIIKLKRENIDGLILDVRFNGGGSINEGLELTGIFVDEGPLAGQKDKTGKLVYYKDPNRGVIYNGPLALMVNGQSASASEMLAASLQDYNRAVIVGSTTYGKASVQQLLPLDSSFNPNSTRMPATTTEVLKITLGKFYRLDGQSAQLKGVKPDIVLPDAFDGLDIGERFERNALSSDTTKKNSYYKPLSPLPVTELAKRSADRIKKDDDFKNIENMLEAQASLRRSRTATIPLKWEEFGKWVKQYETEADLVPGKIKQGDNKFKGGNNLVDKQWLENDSNEKEINKKWLENIEDDFYIRETFLVICDLINLQKAPTKN